jgi:hypothetical protein
VAKAATTLTVADPGAAIANTLSRRPAEAIGPGKQVAERLALFQGQQALPPMLKLIVQHVGTAGRVP